MLLHHSTPILRIARTNAHAALFRAVKTTMGFASIWLDPAQKPDSMSYWSVGKSTVTNRGNPMQNLVSFFAGKEKGFLPVPLSGQNL
jgi:hypothetical protein